MSDNLFIEPVAPMLPEVMELINKTLETADDFDQAQDDYIVRLKAIEDQLATNSDQLAKLTDAVNNFGKMLDFIVGSVESMANMVKDKGLAGIMGMAMGGNKNG